MPWLPPSQVIDGKSERGDHPVVRLPMKQWMLRITAYADRWLVRGEGGRTVLCLVGALGFFAQAESLACTVAGCLDCNGEAQQPACFLMAKHL